MESKERVSERERMVVGEADEKREVGMKDGQIKIRVRPHGLAVREGDRVLLNCFAELTPGMPHEEMTVPAKILDVTKTKSALEICSKYNVSWIHMIVSPTAEKNCFVMRQFLDFVV